MYQITRKYFWWTSLSANNTWINFGLVKPYFWATSCVYPGPSTRPVFSPFAPLVSKIRSTFLFDQFGSYPRAFHMTSPFWPQPGGARRITPQPGVSSQRPKGIEKPILIWIAFPFFRWFAIYDKVFIRAPFLLLEGFWWEGWDSREANVNKTIMYNYGKPEKWDYWKWKNGNLNIEPIHTRNQEK